MRGGRASAVVPGMPRGGNARGKQRIGVNEEKEKGSNGNPVLREDPCGDGGLKETRTLSCAPRIGQARGATPIWGGKGLKNVAIEVGAGHPGAGKG